MKKSFFAIAAFVLTGFVFANDTYFFTSGGNLIPQEESDISVQMKSEVITLTLEKDHYEVNVDFDFYNTGDTVDLLVGFPFFEAGIGGHGKFYDFKCWTNGVITDYSDQPLVRNFSNNNYNGEVLENAYTRIINFPAKKTTKTKVNYKSEYGRSPYGMIVSYLYGTGSSWKNSIGEMTLIIENNIPYERPDAFSLPEENVSFERVADNKWEAHFYNIEPEYTDCISFNVEDILDATGPLRFPGKGFKYSKVKAQTDWLFWYTKPQLRILRNTIYALHGYEFTSVDLQNLFAEWGSEWYPQYKVNKNFSEDDLSEIEKYNVNLILKEEQSRSN